MAELADAADLKSAAARLVGSSPSPGTRIMEVREYGELYKNDGETYLGSCYFSQNSKNKNNSGDIIGSIGKY